MKCSPDIESQDLLNKVKLCHGQPRLLSFLLAQSHVIIKPGSANLEF